MASSSASRPANVIETSEDETVATQAKRGCAKEGRGLFQRPRSPEVCANGAQEWDGDWRVYLHGGASRGTSGRAQWPQLPFVGVGGSNQPACMSPPARRCTVADNKMTKRKILKTMLATRKGAKVVNHRNVGALAGALLPAKFAELANRPNCGCECSLSLVLPAESCRTEATLQQTVLFLGRSCNVTRCGETSSFSSLLMSYWRTCSVSVTGLLQQCDSGLRLKWVCNYLGSLC